MSDRGEDPDIEQVLEDEEFLAGQGAFEHLQPGVAGQQLDDADHRAHGGPDDAHADGPRLKAAVRACWSQGAADRWGRRAARPADRR